MTMMYVAITESEELSAARLDSPPMQHVPAAMLLLLQQGLGATGFSSPPGGDTVGYWQQRVAYTIVATLDEREQKVRAQGRLRYVNSSPDTLREMFLHQYLNAFRPGSDWSAADERAGVERFQRLEEPHFGYERFTSPVRVNGTAVVVEYTGAPDSTVARFALPRPLRPGDSVDVAFDWEARPSTVARRQGRRGRHWDLAQWYPKVAVYDRGGWQHNSLKPAGEFYGEFGTYDVTLVVAEAQVIGATGVPVSGDPGWQRARRAGVVRDAANAYDAIPPPPPADVPSGFKAVRFFARDVHHFAWSASPDYRYEGGEYVRRNPDTRFRTWDTVAIHALYRAGDDTTWGGQRVVNRTINALRWLEAIFGPYAYPQMTVLHRIDGGGTEFPMMQMNGSPSQGLILHEGGHVWTYGILANNEWRSGWMDEGFTSYQTEWAQGLTPQERVRAGVVDRFVEPVGYRARAITMAIPRFDAIGLQRTLTDFEGRAQPIGTVAHRFRDFGTYNDMIYNRAQVMYGQLRDALGDSLFAAFMHDYYARWALRHVDERAMRASAERVSGRDLGWFFDQWVHRTGVMDYSMGRSRISKDSAGWLTALRVVRRGEYRHPITVGVRTADGWTTVRMSEPYESEWVHIRTTNQPLDARLDPFHFSWDWDRRNDRWSGRGTWPRLGIDWPFLAQTDRERSVNLLAPIAWYSRPLAAVVGARMRGSYLGVVDREEFGMAIAPHPNDRVGDSQFQYWARFENPYLPALMRRPAMGWTAGFAGLDGILRSDLGYRRDRSDSRGSSMWALALNVASVRDTSVAPELWTESDVIDLSLESRTRRLRDDGGELLLDASTVLGHAGGDGSYVKAESSAGFISQLSERATLGLRVYVGMTRGVEVGQRALHASSEDAMETFRNHWWRPRGGLLKTRSAHWLPLGGAGLRGYHWAPAFDQMTAVNGDVSRLLRETRRASAALALRVHAFADAAWATGTGLDETLTDAGVGVSLRGRVYDRPIHLRVDSPFFVSSTDLAIDRASAAGRRQIAPRWVVTFSDPW
jgi:hypothetical protein